MTSQMNSYVVCETVNKSGSEQVHVTCQGVVSKKQLDKI